MNEFLPVWAQWSLAVLGGLIVLATFVRSVAVPVARWMREVAEAARTLARIVEHESQPNGGRRMAPGDVDATVKDILLDVREQLEQQRQEILKRIDEGVRFKD